jgi:hypothetical protein
MTDGAIKRVRRPNADEDEYAERITSEEVEKERGGKKFLTPKSTCGTKRFSQRDTKNLALWKLNSG